MFNFKKFNFWEEWKVVLSIIFSPKFLFFVVATCVLLYFSINYKDNIPFSNTMAIIGSIFGGIAGAFLKDEYDKISGKNILEKKGRSAWRNLQNINTQLCNIMTWVSGFSKEIKKSQKHTLDEISRHISTIKLNIETGLEDWVDIVPELKEKSQLDAEYKKVAQNVMIELLRKRKEFAITKDKKIGQELKKKISDLEKQIKEIKRDRSQALDSIGLTTSDMINEHIGRPLININDNILASSTGTERCIICGKKFFHNYLLPYPNNICDDCKNKDLVESKNEENLINIKKDAKKE